MKLILSVPYVNVDQVGLGRYKAQMLLKTIKKYPASSAKVMKALSDKPVLNCGGFLLCKRAQKIYLNICQIYFSQTTCVDFGLKK